MPEGQGASEYHDWLALSFQGSSLYTLGWSVPCFTAYSPVALEKIKDMNFVVA